MEQKDYILHKDNDDSIVIACQNFGLIGRKCPSYISHSGKTYEFERIEVMNSKDGNQFCSLLKYVPMKENINIETHCRFSFDRCFRQGTADAYVLESGKYGRTINFKYEEN